MRKKDIKDKRKPSRKSAAVDPRHPLIGTWVEKGKKGDITAVAYTIALKDGLLSVSGLDESTGTALRISNSGWDGESLHFVSLYPPTKHKATHELLLTKGTAKHTISWSDEDGDQTVVEVWKKR
jgi:hypothetical protein